MPLSTINLTNLMQIYNEYKYTSQQIEQYEFTNPSRASSRLINIFIFLNSPLSLFHEMTYNVSCNDIKIVHAKLHINPAFSLLFLG